MPKSQNRINRIASKSQFPVLLFLGASVSLVFLFLGISLVFLRVFCLFFEDSHSDKHPWCFRGFLSVFEKTKEKKDKL